MRPPDLVGEPLGDALIDDAAFDKQLVKGRHLATSGRLAEAEAVLQDALTRVRGLGDANESKACGSLATFYAIQGRHFEALVLYRQGLAIDRRRGQDALAVRHLSNIATVLAALGLREQLPALFDTIAETHQRLDNEAARRAESLDLWARYQLALSEGDLPYLDELHALLRDTWGHVEEPRVQVNLVVVEAELLGARDRHAEARRSLERGLALSGIADADRVDLEIRRLRCLEGERAISLVVPASLDALVLLRAMLGEPLHAARTILHGTTLGDVLTRYERLAEAHEAYDIAATATMERIRQLDDCMSELPELTGATEAEFTWLRDLRVTFKTQQRELLQHVGAQLERARREGTSPIHDRKANHDLVRLCAWCGTVGTPSGQWLPVAHYVPDSEDVRVTHTICERCASQMRGTV